MRKQKMPVIVKKEIDLKGNIFSHHIQTLKTKFMFLTMILNFKKEKKNDK